MSKYNDDKNNDCVFTPQEVTDLMCKLCDVNDKSVVIDNTAGVGNLIKAAIKNGAKPENCYAVEYKGDVFKEQDLDGVNTYNGDGYTYNLPYSKANVFLSNPPYSEKDKGVAFAVKASKEMKNGFICILTQDSAGNGQAKDSFSEILKNFTLVASIKMPERLFCAGATVNTNIYLFKYGKHDKNKEVIFIDFSNDGYNRRKQKQSCILTNKDHAEERYKEIVDIIKSNKEPSYYKDSIVIDKINVDGNSLNYAGHHIIDTTPTFEDFYKTVCDYLDFKIRESMRESMRADNLKEMEQRINQRMHDKGYDY